MSDRLDHLKLKFVDNVVTVLKQLQMLTGSEQKHPCFKPLGSRIEYLSRVLQGSNVAEYADEMAKRYYETIVKYKKVLNGHTEKNQTVMIQNNLLFTLFDIKVSESSQKEPCATAMLLSALAGDDVSLTNLWQVLADLYRTAILLRIYSSNSNVKEIVSLLLNSNVSLSKRGLSNLKNFKSKMRMKHLLEQTLNDDSGNMDELVNYLKEIAETFGNDQPELKHLLNQFKDFDKSGDDEDQSLDATQIEHQLGAFMSKLSPELQDQVKMLSKEWGLPLPHIG